MMMMMRKMMRRRKERGIIPFVIASTIPVYTCCDAAESDNVGWSLNV